MLLLTTTEYYLLQRSDHTIVNYLLKYKVDSISSIYETKQNWTKAYSIAFLSEPS